ncbi:MAG: CHAD domain-containing protein [Miltoncostaeaceae bacterium]
MAKPRRVAGIDPERRMRPNARRILATRLDEVYQYDGVVADPANITELHDMRIACKRLRYQLEIFSVAFEKDLEPIIEQVKDLQDVLGDIHDCDVQVPLLQDHLAWLQEREASGARALVGSRARRSGGGDREADIARFARELSTTNRADERPGVHALITRRRRERDALYARFLNEWRRLKRERFRARVERTLGIA